jgi:hypothetical protein
MAILIGTAAISISYSIKLVLKKKGILQFGKKPIEMLSNDTSQMLFILHTLDKVTDQEFLEIERLSFQKYLDDKTWKEIEQACSTADQEARQTPKRQEDEMLEIIHLQKPSPNSNPKAYLELNNRSPNSSFVSTSGQYLPRSGKLFLSSTPLSDEDLMELPAPPSLTPEALVTTINIRGVQHRIPRDIIHELEKLSIPSSLPQ